jgi:hypothetical protein
LTGSARDQRTKLRDAAKKIRGLLPANPHTIFPDEERLKLITGYFQVVQFFIDQLNESRDAAWNSLLDSVRSGKAPAQAALDKLAEPPAPGLAGILAKNKFRPVSYDGQNVLGLQIDRYQGPVKPLNWLPNLEFAGNATWRLTDTTPGSEADIPLREAK